MNVPTGSAARRSPAVLRWAANGPMALTGRSDGPPLGPPDRLVGALDDVANGVIEGDPLVLLGERAALGGLTRRAPASCGGATRLLACADGWIALSLARAVPDAAASDLILERSRRAVRRRFGLEDPQ